MSNFVRLYFHINPYFLAVDILQTTWGPVSVLIVHARQGSIAHCLWSTQLRHRDIALLVHNVTVSYRVGSAMHPPWVVPKAICGGRGVEGNLTRRMGEGG